MNFIIHNIEEYKESIKKCKGSRYFDKHANTLSWILRSPDEFNDPEIRKIFQSNVSICDEALRLLNKRVIYGGFRTGTLTGVEITEEDFYWVINDDDKKKEISSSCVGGAFHLDDKLLERAIKYGEIEKINNTPIEVAFIYGAIWRNSNPTEEMIEKILELSKKSQDIDYIIKNYK